MGPKSAAKGRARRTHSLGGCATCRRRHVKCDQVQPLCLTCKAVGVVCEGYASNVQWMHMSSDKTKVKKAEANTTRRHLYSEQSRASMSTELTANLSSNSVDASLSEIDTWSKTNQSSTQETLAVGPFGVLSFGNAAPISTNDDTQPVTEEAEAEVIEDRFPTPSTIDPLMSLDDSLQWADLFALDFGNEFLMQQDPFAPIMQDVDPQVESSGFQTRRQTLTSVDQAAANTQQHTTSMGSGILLAPVSPLADATAPSVDLLGDTHVLLRHFQDKVIDAMAGVPWTQKSPWKIMMLANAVQTLADMTYLGEKTVKHANAANLYSLVSSAACHMAAKPSSTSHIPPIRLSQIADWSLDKAKLHLEQSMHNEFSGPNKVKYKDQLMATMSVQCACQFLGKQADVRRYLLESERVLRLRGLAKRDISRKARLLHHVYTWMRIVSESTYVIHDYTSYAPVIQSVNLHHQRRIVRPRDTEDLANSTTEPSSSSASAKHNSRLDDFLRIETQHDSDLEIDEQKDATIGLHDIHLEDAREDPASLYYQIYGIPETWLSLVSQTTRLANVMDTLKVSNKETNVAFQNALQKRAGRLENMICSFAYKTVSTTPTSITGEGDDENTTTVLPNHHMVQALNSALVIFFYRRIRDVNPWILQSHVDDVIKALQDFHKTLVDQKKVGPGTAWPAFIAGCEAISSHRREALLKLIQAGNAMSGLRSYKAAEEMIREVWRRRDDANNGPSPRTAKSSSNSGTSTRTPLPQWTWLDVSREKNIWLMLA